MDYERLSHVSVERDTRRAVERLSRYRTVDVGRRVNHQDDFFRTLAIEGDEVSRTRRREIVELRVQTNHPT